MASFVLVGFGGLFLLGGFMAIRQAFLLRKQANIVEETPTEDVESISMGQSEVTGVATPTDEGTIPAPFTDDECLVALWEVDKFRRKESGNNAGVSWKTLGRGLDTVEFFVDDGTGQLLVRPTIEAEFDVDTDAEDPVVVGDGADPPPAVAAFLDRDDWDQFEGPVHGWESETEDTDRYDDGDRRFRQHLIEPGEEVYVIGVARPRDDVRSADNAANVVVETVPEGDEDLEDLFLISDLDEEHVVENRRGSMWLFPLGLVLATAGFGVVLRGFGLF